MSAPDATRAEVLVLGAGMAGLAAARRLHDAGLRVTVLEARDRIGGRVHTDRDFAGFPIEFGAEFIHGERAATWPLVRQLGLRTLRWRKEDDSLVRLEDDQMLTMSEARARYPDFDVTRSWQLPDVQARPNEDWRSYLLRIGFSRSQLQYVKRSYANACGESMRFLSARAMLRQIRGSRESGNADFRILDGYGTLADHLARGLDVRLGHEATAIDWHPGRPVRVETAQGTFQARALVLTLPVGVLEAGTIRFEPELPPVKQQALAGLRMGPVIKMVFRFPEPILEPHLMALYSALNPPMWWSPSFGQETDAHVWTAFVSGGWAMELLELGEQGALDEALDSLRLELGRPGLKALAARLVDWPEDPWARGGYSFVLPGHDGARALLASPTPPLYWAGEASEPEHRAATVHGAYLSGLRAATEALAALAPAAIDFPRPYPEGIAATPAASGNVEGPFTGTGAPPAKPRP